MLRRTASRAFGPGECLKSAMPLAPGEADRTLALDRLFHEIHRALEGEVARFQEADGDGAAALWHLSRPRSLSQGMEFALDGPRAAFAFLHTMAGHIQVRAAEKDSLRAGETRFPAEPCVIIALHPLSGAYRPIVKPLPAGAPWPPRSFQAPRSGFIYTSVGELARRYVNACDGLGEGEGCDCEKAAATASGGTIPVDRHHPAGPPAVRAEVCISKIDTARPLS